MRWLAPECFKDFAHADTATDMWAFGVTLWEIATVGLTPYADVPLAQVEAHVASGKSDPVPAMVQLAGDPQEPTRAPLGKGLYRPAEIVVLIRS